MAKYSERFEGYEMEDDGDITWSDGLSPLTGREFIIGGGGKAMERFIASFRPGGAEALDDVLGRGKTGPISEAIHRGGVASGDSKIPSSKSIARQLQRWKVFYDGTASKQARKPQLATVQKNQRYYERATGKPSPALRTLENLVSGKTQSGRLGKGDLTITIHGDIEAYPENPENRSPRAVSIPILAHETKWLARAIIDPTDAWLRLFFGSNPDDEDVEEPEVYSIDWMRLTFVER